MQLDRSFPELPNPGNPCSGVRPRTERCSALRNHMEQGHGYHHPSDHHRCAAVTRRRLVRPRTLVLVSEEASSLALYVRQAFPVAPATIETVRPLEATRFLHRGIKLMASASTMLVPRPVWEQDAAILSRPSLEIFERTQPYACYFTCQVWRSPPQTFLCFGGVSLHQQSATARFLG